MWSAPQPQWKHWRCLRNYIPAIGPKKLILLLPGQPTSSKICKGRMVLGLFSLIALPLTKLKSDYMLIQIVVMKLIGTDVGGFASLMRVGLA